MRVRMYMLLEEANGAGPGIGCRGLMVAAALVAVKSMTSIRVGLEVVGHAGLLELGLRHCFFFLHPLVAPTHYSP